jgi:hypothetical protein
MSSKDSNCNIIFYEESSMLFLVVVLYGGGPSTPPFSLKVFIGVMLGPGWTYSAV